MELVNGMPVVKNLYPGVCNWCNLSVASNEGLAVKVSGQWKKYCQGCFRVRFVTDEDALAMRTRLMGGR